jgi:hypothetical protein
VGAEMTNLDIPRFAALGRHHGGAQHRLHPRLVAAIRYDYEVALLDMAQVVRKYRLVVNETTAREIMNGVAYPEVKAEHHRLAWCKKSWSAKP